jgi:hypothetical protein
MTSRVVIVEPGGGHGCSTPLAGPFLSLLIAGRGGDQPGELRRAGRDQGARIGEAFQHRQVGFAQVTGERGHRHPGQRLRIDPVRLGMAAQ